MGKMMRIPDGGSRYPAPVRKAVTGGVVTIVAVIAIFFLIKAVLAAAVALAALAVIGGLIYWVLFKA